MSMSAAQARRQAVAQALEEATAAGMPIRVQIIKAGYAPAAPAQG